MDKRALKRMAVRVGAVRPGRRSDAYRWVRANYGLLKKMLEGKPSWRVMADEVAALGVLGARGQRLTADRLREMWGRVCRDVAIEEAEKRAVVVQRKKQPRDLPETWQPVPSATDGQQRHGALPVSSFALAKQDMDELSGRPPVVPKRP
jgi:hypothetical protein